MSLSFRKFRVFFVQISNSHSGQLQLQLSDVFGCKHFLVFWKVFLAENREIPSAVIISSRLSIFFVSNNVKKNRSVGTGFWRQDTLFLFALISREKRLHTEMLICGNQNSGCPCRS